MSSSTENDSEGKSSSELTTPGSSTPPSTSAESTPPATVSGSGKEWKRRKHHHDRRRRESNEFIDKLMRYEGLEEVKQQFIDIKSKVDIAKKQKKRMKHERFNVIFQGNPGTGKTTIARLYAKFLHSVGVLKSSEVKELSGTEIGMSDPTEIKTKIEDMLEDGGGVLFVDEAYQLTAPYVGGSGKQALDIILTRMENNIGKLAVIFVGYKDEMESFYEHNPGLASRIPYTMRFADFSDGQLWKILYDNIHSLYKGKMKVEDGLNGLYMRIAIRRLAQSRGGRGFGNARAVQNLLARISQRQAQRITRELKDGKKKKKKPDYFLFTKEDMIGPEPDQAVEQSEAWSELQSLVGLEVVKESAKSMMRMIQLNYRRELKELSPLSIPLNQVFVGAPGTGKTTVAKLYGRILADLGLLSRGDVVLKNPSDFVGQCLGESENKTKQILEANVGKVLVIDEAYMLDPGDPSKSRDSFKNDVIDTIVAIVQGVPGEDRCIILVGYEDKITNMFRNVNPGLARRFPIQNPFRFSNFSMAQLELILHKKLREQDLQVSPAALETVRAMFERGLMRPDFTNAGEVDGALAAAKKNYEIRQSKQSPQDQAIDGLLEPEDFDKDFDRGTSASTAVENCLLSLRGLVHESIIQKLVDYQSRCLNAKKQGFDPRKVVPTNFVFKGYPGTGKTTAAQHMGKIFYEMGFLSTTEVVECTATDLIGQYIGQTAPKARRQLEQGLGKVLVIDDAPRLAHGTHFAPEAVDELVHFLSRPNHAGRIVVILAGDTDGMHLLMSKKLALSALFPEEVVFDNLPSEDCIALLLREIEHGFGLAIAEDHPLRDMTSESYLGAGKLFGLLGETTGWSNARDVKQLAKQVFGKYLEGPSFSSVSRCALRSTSYSLSPHQTAPRESISQQPE
ncbi:P-loop containing nucleoside triphosphate hydrolase protein [Podospora didyma]|uniref:P-loop containing nucleoside triphosphate hydrolase protein n=1 Tax=Podospora didyma TaxID=330526 RepID=A0AAE0KEB2_9PEZI|nr:P-loop containing nucleoside triphosphate hydrolase protein [Podospora didyma]